MLKIGKMELECCVTQCEKPLDAEYWDSQWKSETTGWDLGMACPQLTHFIDIISDKSSRVLIPGCGSAYEAEYLLKKGFQDITLIDIAENACDRLRQKFNGESRITILCEDFFNLDSKFDTIIEQTFFCALPPSMRIRYVWKMHQILNPGGKIQGVLFNKQFEKAGPPFGGDIDEYKRLFGTLFQIEQMELAEHSATPRAGSELAISLIKNSEIQSNLYKITGVTCSGCKKEIEEKFKTIEGVTDVMMSGDFSEVLVISKDEVELSVLTKLLAYEPKYSLEKYN